MMEGNTSPLLDFPSILPLCLPEVLAGVQRALTRVHSSILCYDDSIICQEAATTKQNCTRKTGNILAWSLSLSSHLVEKTDKV